MKTDDALKEFYGGRYAESYDRTHSPRRVERLMASLELRAQDDVVDFGCGSGMLMPLVAPRVNTYTGVDFSRQFIAIANAKKTKLGIENAIFECSSIAEFCTRQARAFDVAFAIDFSEHVVDQEWVQVLAAIRKSLVSGGKLFLHTPNGRFFLEIMKKHGFLVRQFPEHVAVRTVEENVALLSKAGFGISEVRLIPHYNILRLLHPLSVVPLVGSYFEARILIEASN